MSIFTTLLEVLDTCSRALQWWKFVGWSFSYLIRTKPTYSKGTTLFLCWKIVNYFDELTFFSFSACKWLKLSFGLLTFNFFNLFWEELLSWTEACLHGIKNRENKFTWKSSVLENCRIGHVNWYVLFVIFNTPKFDIHASYCNFFDFNYFFCYKPLELT